MIEGEVTSRRALRDHYHEAMKAAIAARRSDVPGGEWDGVPVVTEKDLFDALADIFLGPPPAAPDGFAEVATPANVLVHAECPRCGIPAEINVLVHAVLTVDDDGAELSVKGKSKARTHVCGQLPLPVTGETSAGEQMNLSDWIGPTVQELVVDREPVEPDDLPDDEEKECGATASVPDLGEPREGVEPILDLGCIRAIDHEGDHYDGGGQGETPDDVIPAIAWHFETVPVPQGVAGNEDAPIMAPADGEEEGSDGDTND